MGTVPTEIHPEYKQAPGGRTMKALAWFGTEDVRIVDAPIPDITEKDDVIVKVTGTTSVLALQKGDIMRCFMGLVKKVGPNGKDLQVGQRVVASFQIACGDCEYFINYMYGQRDAGFFGYSHFTGGFPGGQAEYVLNLLPIPDNVTDEQAIYLSDILPTSYHAVTDTGVQNGDVVGIWGLGPIGQCAVRWAVLKGASRIIGIDSVPARLAFAQKKSSIEVIDFKEHKDVVKRVYELVPRGLNVAIDCGTFHEPKSFIHKAQKALKLETDVPETINEMLVSVRKMGRCGLIAVYTGFANGVDVGALMGKGIRLIGNGQAPVHKYWEEIMNEYVIPGKFDPTLSFSDAFLGLNLASSHDMSDLYRAFDKRQGRVQKVFVETEASRLPSKGCPQTTRVADWAE
ncbi:GroES-like protein [Tricholoma matsutake]|nr:GroES-like protein [Tricholoma matsutake 945]